MRNAVLEAVSTAVLDTFLKANLIAVLTSCVANSEISSGAQPGATYLTVSGAASRQQPLHITQYPYSMSYLGKKKGFVLEARSTAVLNAAPEANSIAVLNAMLEADSLAMPNAVLEAASIAVLDAVLEASFNCSA